MTGTEKITALMTGVAFTLLFEAVWFTSHHRLAVHTLAPDQIFDLHNGQHAIIVDRVLLGAWLGHNRNTTVKIVSISPEQSNVVTTSYLIVYMERR